MGPSLVLSSVTRMAADWNRNSLTSSFNQSSSSNEEIEDEEHHVRQRDGPHSGRNNGLDHHPRSAQPITTASFRVTSTVEGYIEGATDAYNTRASSQVEISTTTTGTGISSTRRDPLFHGLDFSMSPLFSSTTTGQTSRHSPVPGRNNTEIRDGSDDDDRKPAALPSLRQYPTQHHLPSLLCHDERTSPHRKSHSISADPFRSAAGSPIVSHQIGERYIDPTLSFGDDDVAQAFEEGQFILPPTWDSSEQRTALPVNQQHQFTPPHADFNTPTHLSASAAPTPPPIAFRLGDDLSDQFNHPSTRSVGMIGDVKGENTVLRRTVPIRPSLPFAALPSAHLTDRNLSLLRRQPTSVEIESAETDRARSAIHVWYKRFNELIEFCETFGDCNVPQKYAPNPQLGIWVNKQRMEKKFMDENKRTSMTATKIEALESIGFTWAKRKGDASWMYKYHELRKYLHQFGSCDVPTKYTPNPALGRWVSTQRSEYKIFMQNQGRSRHLTQDKIEMLNAIGFKWEMIPSRLSNASSHSHSNSSGGGSHATNVSSHSDIDHIRSREV